MPEGLSIGEAAVTAQDGKCHVLAINITDQDIEFSVSPQEVISFDFCTFSGKNFSDTEIEDLPEYPQEELWVSYSDRVNRVMQNLHVSDLTPEEKDVGAGDYADIFYLNGEKHTSTHLIQYRIPVTDDKIIAKKQ